MVGDWLQPTHILFVLVVALLVLGPKRLPEVGRSLGKGIRDFRHAMAGLEEHTTGLLTPDEPARTATSTTAGTTQVVSAHTPVADAPIETAPSAAAIAHARASTRSSSVTQAVEFEPDPSEYAD